MPKAKFDEIVAEEEGRILIEASLEAYPIVQLLTQVNFAARNFIRDQFQDRLNETVQAKYANVFLVVRGFGGFFIETMRGQELKQTAPARWYYWWMHRRGGLLTAEFVYLFALMARRQGGLHSAWSQCLNADIIKQIGRAETYLEEHPPRLFDDEFRLEQDLSTDVISRMLRVGGATQIAALRWLIDHQPKSHELSEDVAKLLAVNDESLLATAVQAFAATTLDETNAIELVRPFLCHRSNLVIGCAYQSLKCLGDDPDYLSRVAQQLEKRGIPYDPDA